MTLRLPDRLRPAAEDGFGIIEVLVSAILVVMVATGVFVVFDSATKASGTNKARSVAANLARTDQERLRGLTAQELSTLPPESIQRVDGKPFTIESTTEWVADRTGQPTCTSADGRADYLKMRSSVTWPDMGPLKPVVVESLRAIPRGAFRPNQGSISVKVTDRNGAGVSGASVSISGPQSFSGTTNALGCVLIDQVPVGSYSAAISKALHVTDAYPNDATVTKPFPVAKEQTSSVPVTLDRAATVRAAFRSTATVGGAESSTTGDGFTIAHTGLIDPTLRSFTLATPTGLQGTLYSGSGSAALTSNATRTVFPFATAYNVWAGACDAANPALQTPPQPVASRIFAPGVLAAALSIREPRMEITVRRYNTAAEVSTDLVDVKGQRVTVTPVVSSCARAASANTTSTATTPPTPLGIAAFTMPYGEYSICAQDSSSATAARRRRGVLRTNGAAGGTAYNALYDGSAIGGAGEPANGAIILPNAQSASTPC